MKVWLDGALLDAAAPALRPLDRGFLFGDGLFETLRAYAGTPFLLEAHLQRLEAGCAAVGIAAPPRQALRGAVEAVLHANAFGESDARVRITVSRGATPGDLWPEDPGPPTVLVTAHPVALPPALYAEGIAAVVSAHRVLSGAPRVKSTSFQAHVLAKAEASRAGAWEALLCNERGEVAEGSTSNVFAVRADGSVVTPPPDAGLLPGVTRRVVLELARAQGMHALEAPLPLPTLHDARELFLTSSVAELIPVVRLDGRAVGAGEPGPVTQALRQAYRTEVARSIGNGKSKRNEGHK